MADKFEFSNRDLSEMKRAVKVRWILSVAIVGANLLLVWAAWCDHGWGRLGLANLWGPVMNGLFMAVAALAYNESRQVREFQPWLYGLTYIGLPAVAIAVDWILIMMMGANGC